MEQAIQIPFKAVIQQDEQIQVEFNKSKNSAKITCKNGHLFAETDIMKKLNFYKFDDTELKDLMKHDHLAVLGDFLSPKSEKLRLREKKAVNAKMCTPDPSSMGSQGDSL